MPCTGNIPGGEPNIGLPNGILAHIGCGQNLVVDLGAVKAIAVTGSAEPAFDIVYYELENPATNVNLDWVIVEIGTSPSGPWHQVFYWGDDILDANTNIGQLGYGPSASQTISLSPSLICMGAIRLASLLMWMRWCLLAITDGCVSLPPWVEPTTLRKWIL